MGRPWRVLYQHCCFIFAGGLVAWNVFGTLAAREIPYGIASVRGSFSEDDDSVRQDIDEDLFDTDFSIADTESELIETDRNVQEWDQDSPFRTIVRVRGSSYEEDTISPLVEPAPPISSPLVEPLGEGTSSYELWPGYFALFMGLDGAKQPQDFGVNALFGGRAAIEAAWIIKSEWNLGLQAGTSINFSDNAVQVFERVEGTKHRVQSYTTVGLYQRMDSGLYWGVGYDFLNQNYFDRFSLGQWRGRVGYELNETNDVGVWFTVPQKSDSGLFATIPLELKPIQQTNIYWSHQWESKAVTTVWVGYARRHGEVNLALGDLAPVGVRPVFGAELHAPLNDYLALFGQGNFIRPSDSGTVDAFLGVTFYPGGGARCMFRNRSAPVLPLVNNSMFATDLVR